MITDALLKKTIETPTIKIHKKKERTITLIPFLNLPFNFTKSKGIKVRIIIIKSPRGVDLTDLIKNES